MKSTKKNVIAFVRKQLGENKAWATKALVRIFNENQMPDEKNSESTIHDNGIGFSGVDSKFLSSLAKQAIETGSLSDKQMVFVFRLMPRYSRQVYSFSDKEKLTKMVEESLSI